jgi:protein tyrosine/serine phosphatase
MESASPRLSRRRQMIVLAAAICATCLTVIGVVFGVRLSDNFDVVEAGLAYRSGQLWPDELDTVVRQNGIRSIISLSQPEPDKAWYRGEVAISAARHIARYEMPLSPQTELTSTELHRLVALLREAPKPVLIHSRCGADRTGLAAAIFVYAIASRSVDEAKSQLSIRYGHFPYVAGNTGAMDSSFQKFLREQRARATDS